MKKVKKVVLLILFIITVSVGASLSFKVGIGVGAWDAITQTFSFMSGIKVGTLGMILNISCVLGQAILLKKDFKLIQLLQIPVSILLGVFINFILYNILAGFTISSYIVKVILLFVSYAISAFGVAAVMSINMVTLALEGFCMAISSKTGYEFSKLRQLVDIISIIAVIICTLLFKTQLTLREGTIIGMIVFGPLIGFFMKKLKPILIKYEIIESELIVEYEVKLEA